MRAIALSKTIIQAFVEASKNEQVMMLTSSVKSGL